MSTENHIAWIFWEYDQFLFQKFVGVYSMKVQIRTIDLEKYMHEHILSPGEGSNMVNVVILLAFKALLMDFPINWRQNIDKKAHTFWMWGNWKEWANSPKIKR